MRTASAGLMLLALVTSGARAERLPPMPLHFIRNVGQTDPAVGYMVKGAGPDLYFANEEIVLREAPRECGEGAIVRLRFENASPAMHLEPLEALPGVAHFYLGNDPAAWRENVPLHAGVAYREAWPGIDAIYRGTDGRLKAQFEVAAGADERLIRLSFSGVSSLRLRQDGALVLTTATGELVEQAPETWEEGVLGRRALASRFVVLGPDRVGFMVDGRDASAKLIIDPVLDYSSYVGGSAEDDVTFLREGSGILGACGRTRSPDFPATLGAPPVPGSWDAWYMRVDLAASTMKVGFIGGSGDETPVSFGGTTFSPDFPLLRATQSTYGGEGDAYFVNFDPASGALVQSTYVGGSRLDRALAGEAQQIVGQTWSPDFPIPWDGFSFPVPFDRSLGGASDGFVATVNDGTAGPRSRATFVGGSGDDAVTACDQDFIGGWTESSDFPRGTGGSGAALGGSRDAFTAVMLGGAEGLSGLGTTHVLGGSGIDEITSTNTWRLGTREELRVVGGRTESPDFPLHGPTQASPGGGMDGWIAVLDGVDLLFSTYVGGSGDDEVSGVAADLSRHVRAAGTTTSVDFPLVRPLQASLRGTSDAFVIEINPFSAPSRVGWSTYLGSGGSDVVTAAGDGSPGCIVLGGTTDGADFPTRRAVQPLPGGGGDGFLARICETDVLAQRDPAEQLVEVIERLERIESQLDLTDLRDSVSRIEGCCDAAQGKLDDLLDFADDATARLDAIEDLLDRLAREQQDELLRDIETSLFARQCVPWLWLPEAEGHLRLAREHVARRLEEALASGDPGVNEGVARARLDAADREMAASSWQDGCKRLSDALHALTSP